MANDSVVDGVTASLQPSLEFQRAVLEGLHSDEVAPHMITHFFSHLDAIFEQDTRHNIQTCAEWILQHIISSENRIILLGKYLVSLSESINVQGGSGKDQATRNRLDLVFLISDVLHAVKFHRTSEDGTAQHLQPYVKELVALVAYCCHERNTKHERQLKAVIKFWYINMLFTTDHISAIMESARGAFRVARGDTVRVARERNDTFPRYFGETDAVDYELPASYALIGRPSFIRGEPSKARSREMPGKPSQKVIDLLDAYFENVEAIYRPTGDNPLGASGGYKQWTDAAGHPMTQHKTTSSMKKMTNGLGWSMDLCKDIAEGRIPAKLTKLRAELIAARMDLDGNMDVDSGDPQTYGSGRSRSRSPRRRRYSSGSDYDRYERRRGERSLSRSSHDSRDGRSSSRRNGRDSDERRSRSRRNDRDRDDGRPDRRESDTEFGRHKPPPSAASSYSRDPTHPVFNREQSYPQASQGPINTPPGIPRPPPPPPPPFQGQFTPQFQGQAPSQPPNQPPGFQGQFQGGHYGGFPAPPPFPGHGNFPMPPFPPQMHGGQAPGHTGPPNFAPGFPNFPPMGAPGYPNPQGGNPNFGHNQAYGGYNRGGFQGNNFTRGGYGGNNQRGGGPWS